MLVHYDQQTTNRADLGKVSTKEEMPWKHQANHLPTHPGEKPRMSHFLISWNELDLPAFLLVFSGS